MEIKYLAGIIGDEIIGLCVLPNRIRGDDYADFFTGQFIRFFGRFSVKYS